MKNKLVPALIGGAAVFVLSLLVSSIPGVRCCGLFLTILGGVLAAYLAIRKSATPVSKGEGLIVGTLAGVVTGALRLAYLAISYLLDRENIHLILRETEERVKQIGVNFNEHWLTLLILAGVILAVVLLVILEALGGLIGVALFEKRTDVAPTPPLPPADVDAAGSTPGL
jgi:hypothetical protein